MKPIEISSFFIVLAINVNPFGCFIEEERKFKNQDAAIKFCMKKESDKIKCILFEY